MQISEKIFEKQTLYEDLAQYFHRRKVKAIEFRKGISISELNIFITKVSLSPLDLIKEGGIPFILKKESAAHILVEELDYYSLLKTGGLADDERKDVWAYLLNKAISENNQKDIEEFSNNFGSILEKLKSDDLLQNNELMKAFNVFFDYLDKERNPKVRECRKEALKVILRSKAKASKDNIERIKEIVKHLDENDVCNILFNELLTNEKFDMQSMLLFSVLTGKEQHQTIAASLKEKIGKDLRVDAKTIRKIKDLFSGIPNPVVSAIYRKALSAVIEKASGEEGIVLDRDKLYRNYRFMLLNLLELQNTENEFTQIAEKIINELPKVVNSKDIEFIESLLKLLEIQKHYFPGDEQLVPGLYLKVVTLLEEKVLEEKNDFKYFDVFLHKSAFNKDTYFDKIFSESSLNPNTLRLFLHFFPKDTDELCIKIGKQADSPIFLKKIIDNLRGIDLPETNAILIYIFKFANQFLKAEILKTMQSLSHLNENFLMSILEKEDIFLRKQVLLLLARNVHYRTKALETLFSINNFFGLKNKIIEQNINIVSDCDIKETRIYLERFSKIKVFWKKNLKKAAIKALTNLYDRKN